MQKEINKIKLFDEPVTLASRPGMIIPFSQGDVDIEFQYTPNSVILNGTGSANCSIPGFGTSSTSYQLVTGIDSITGNPVRLFFVDTNTNYGFVVAQKYDYANIYMDVTLSQSWTPLEGDFYPYVALAKTESSWNNMYQIIPETVTSVTFTNGVSYPINTVRSNSQVAIPISITKGDRVAVVCGFTTSTDTSSTLAIFNTNLKFSGGIALL